jgi:aryl-alcohol dehydrogenase-like predicted oxidoreductase
MKHRKKEVFLAAKTDVRSRDGALAQIEGSLKRLQTNVIDLIQIHCLSREEEIQQIGEPHGALAAIRKLQEEGVIRFVGVTGHPDSEVIEEAMRVHDFDTVMVPLNATREGGYEKIVLPRAVESGIGVIAMKVLGQGAFIGRGEGKASAVELIRYSLSLPVTLTVMGMDSVDILAQDIGLARSLEPMSKREMYLLSAHMSGAGGIGYWNKLPKS